MIQTVVILCPAADVRANHGLVPSDRGHELPLHQKVLTCEIPLPLPVHPRYVNCALALDAADHLLHRVLRSYGDHPVHMVAHPSNLFSLVLQFFRNPRTFIKSELVSVPRR